MYMGTVIYSGSFYGRGGKVITYTDNWLHDNNCEYDVVYFNVDRCGLDQYGTVEFSGNRIENNKKRGDRKIAPTLSATEE